MYKTAIGVVKVDSICYPTSDEYFRPNELYGDCIFPEVSKETINSVYPAVRKSIELIGFDKKNVGTPQWNPFKELIKEGDCVLLKPNMVQDRNNNKSGETDCLYTHPSVIVPLLDFVFKALNGSGKVIIGDAPIQECNFDKLVKQSGYDKIIDFYKEKGLKIELVDFRKDKSEFKFRINHRSLNPDVKGTVVNLGTDSEFYGDSEATAEKYRIVDYPSSNIQAHHSNDVQEYLISNYVLNADVIINIPKPKAHKKAGVTACLKNLVGMNSQKDYLPHHTFGSVEEGGDEYKEKSWLQNIRSNLYDKKYEYEKKKQFFKAQVVWFGIAFCTTVLKITGTKYENGSWYGNNTISKTITDLNKIVLYADADGKMQSKPVRKYLAVCDMIVSGEKNGPVAPSPKRSGMIISGTNPIEIDKTIVTLMGFDVNKIPTLQQVSNSRSSRIIGHGEKGIIFSNLPNMSGIEYEQIPKEYIMNFIPPDGWGGHIEL